MLKPLSLFNAEPCWLIWAAPLTMSCDCLGSLKLAKSGKKATQTEILILAYSYLILSRGIPKPLPLLEALKKSLPSTNKELIHTTVYSNSSTNTVLLSHGTVCLKKTHTHTATHDQSFQSCDRMQEKWRHPDIFQKQQRGLHTAHTYCSNNGNPNMGNACKLHYGWADPNLQYLHHALIWFDNQRRLIFSLSEIITALKHKILCNALHTMAPNPHLSFFALHGRSVPCFLVRMRARFYSIYFFTPTKNALSTCPCSCRDSQTLKASFAYLQLRAG